MGLRSEKLSLDGRAVMKSLAFVAISAAAGQDIYHVASNLIGPVHPHPQINGWQDLIDAIRAYDPFRITVELTAAAFLASDLFSTSNKGKLRSKSIEIFETPALRKASLMTVSLMLGASLANTYSIVAPYYTPLLTHGVDAFLANLPQTDEGNASAFSLMKSPFDFHALALYTAYRYYRGDILLKPLTGAKQAAVTAGRGAYKVLSGLTSRISDRLADDTYSQTHRQESQPETQYKALGPR